MEFTSAGDVVVNPTGANNDFTVQSNNNNHMLFVDGGNDAVIVNGNTSVSFGSESHELQVNDTNFSVASFATYRNGSDGATLALGHSRNATIGSQTVVQNADKLGQIDFYGSDGTDFARGASISASVQGTPGNNDMPGVLNFATSADGSDSPTTRLSIAADGSLSTPTAGTSNVRFGVNAGNSIASGSTYNVLIGDEAGTAITTGDANVAIGFSALLTEDGHGFNTAVGHETLKTLNAGADAYNTAVGFRAGLSVTTGIRNTLIGGLAGDSLQDADFNVAIGSHSLTTDTLGSKSIAIGHSALEAQNFTSATDTYNIAIGDNTGFAITTGVRNVLIGALAGDAITDADKNIAIGTDALGGNKLGSRSVAIGEAALQVQNPVDGSGNDTAVDMYNTAVGHAAGNAVTTGIFNTLIGGLAGDSLTVGQENVSLGYLSLSTDTKGSHSVAIGPYALQTQNFTSATDTFNTALGYAAGNAVTTGTNNTFVGGLAGDGTDDGVDNTAVGKGALSANCGNGNTAIGLGSLVICTGEYNTGTGYLSGDAITSGGYNALFGQSAGTAVTEGNRNVCIGDRAGVNITTGSDNVMIGQNNNASAADASTNIVMGFQVTGVGANNFTFGNGSTDSNIAFGATSITAPSDERMKEEIETSTAGLAFVNDLRPVTYKWKKEKDIVDTLDAYVEGSDIRVVNETTNHGFIAQEVKTVIDAHPEIKDGFDMWMEKDNDGQQRVAPSALIPVLVKAIQEQQALIEALTARIETLEG